MYQNLRSFWQRFSVYANLAFLLIFMQNQLLAQAPPTSCVVRDLISTTGCGNPAYVLYINGVYYTPTTGVTLTEFADGTAEIVGTVAAGSETIAINLTLTGRTTLAAAGSPKYGLCTTTGGAAWYYYTTYSGTLNSSSSGVKTIAPTGPNLQIGTGGSLNNTSAIGGSSWFQDATTGSYYGDFNFELSAPRPFPFTPTITGNTTICAGQTTILTASNASSYAWSNGETTASITVAPTTTTTYTVTATNAKGCTATATTQIIVNPNPSITITGTSEFYEGQPASLAAQGAGVSDGFAWTTGQNSSTISVAPTTNTTYTVTVTNGSGCTATASKSVTVYHASVDAATICAGGNAGLTATGGTDYRWSSGENVAMVWAMPMMTTVYTVTVSQGTASTTLTTTVTVNPKPTAAVTGDFVLCGGAATVLTATGGATYNWSTGATTNSETISAIGTYTVTVTNSFGCTKTATAQVEYSPIPTVSIAGLSTICAGTTTKLKTTATNATFFQWSTGSFAANIDVTPTTATTYTVTVYAPKGCPTSTSITITPRGCASLGDFIWFDGSSTNSNNVQDTGEPGIEGVVVTLYNSVGNIVATTLTNGRGYYQFTELTPGAYSVGVTTPAGLTPVLQQLNTATGSDIDVITGRTPLITLNNGDNRLDIDAGFKTQPLNRASIGDRVWLDANKNGIQDANESGLGGVKVRLYQTDGVTELAVTETNGLGFYTFTNLMPTGYIVGFELPTAYTLTSKDAGDDALDSDVDLATGKTKIYSLLPNEANMTVDMGVYPSSLPPIYGSIGDFVWEDKNQDGLQTAGERGIPGIIVTLFAADGTTILATTTTDNNGFYIFPFLSDGSYIIRFTNIPLDYLFTSQTLNTTNGSDVDGNGATPLITLAAGQNRTDIDAGLLPGSTHSTKLGAIGDRVWRDTNGNGIQDEGVNSGVEGITVTLLNGTGQPIQVTTTNSGGYYVFSGLPAGTYKVLFGVLPQGASYTTQGAPGSAAATDSDADGSGTTRSIVLTTGEVILTVDAGIIEQARLGDFVWLDTNDDNLQTAGELGIKEVIVLLYRADDLTTILQTTKTDVNGIYYFLVNPGVYVVEFAALTGFGRVAQTNGTDNGSDADFTTGRTPPITIASGQQNVDIDAGLRTVTLPVQLMYFVGAATGCEVTLRWQTATEENNKQFILQRSKNARDYEAIGTIQGAGTISYAQNYSFVDKKPALNNLYRLLQVDFDGKTTTYSASNTVITSGCFDGTVSGVSEVYPNPNMTETAWFKFYSDQTNSEVTISISDIVGRVVATQIVRVAEGANVVPIAIADLSTGHYYIRVSGEGWYSPSQKLVRIKP